jgi:hypothetical protein
MIHLKTLAAAGLMGIAATTAAAVEATRIETEITQGEVEAAQQAWGLALIGISAAHADGGIAAARAAAGQAIDGLYAYQAGPVLFKPTLTQAPQTFRTTREGALAYFVGHDANFPKDSGFALKGWTDFEIQNTAIFIVGDVAKTMGAVRLFNSAGDAVVVDKSWAFMRDEDGALRITLHHSSLPYVAD